MTQLLDLCPEILERILAAFVAKAGVVEAYKARIVCRAFAVCIKYNILAVQPIGSFLKIYPNNGRKILKTNMSVYLQYRIKKLNGAHDTLPKFVTQMLNRIENISGATDERTRTKHEAVICDLLAANFEYVGHFAMITGKCKTSQEMIWKVNPTYSCHLIVAAAGIGDLQALKSLADDPSDLWDKSISLGYPLAAAARKGHVHIVEYILKSLQWVVVTDTRLYFEYAFRDAMVLALKGRHVTIVQNLVKIHPECFTAVEGDNFKAWLDTAVLSRQPALASAIMKLKHDGGIQYYAKAFSSACKIGNPQMIRMFFEQNCLNLNQPLDYCEAPLNLAVLSGNITAISELLRMGANPNGPRLRTGTPPMLRAAYLGYSTVVDMLLDHGADPDPFQNTPDWGKYKTAKDIENTKAVIASVVNARTARLEDIIRGVALG